MSILSIAILILLSWNRQMFTILYFWPSSRIGNGVGVFNAFHNSENEEQKLFSSYLVNWVAGVKLIFYFSSGCHSDNWNRTRQNLDCCGYDFINCNLFLAFASHYKKAGCYGCLHLPVILKYWDG